MGAHFCYKIVHFEIFIWCIVGFVRCVNSKPGSVIINWYILKWKKKWWMQLLHISRVSCLKGPTRHAYPWQIRPFDRIPSISIPMSLGNPFTVCSRYITVMILHIDHKRHPILYYWWGMGCRLWVQIWPKFYYCNCCAVCTIVSYITATYRGSIVFGMELKTVENIIVMFIYCN